MSAENSPTVIPTPEEMTCSLDEALWDWLRPHLERDVMIVVSPELDLVDTGQALARDNVSLIEEMIAAGALAKPSAQQVNHWDAHGQEQKFLLLIVAPYILIQEIPNLVQ